MDGFSFRRFHAWHAGLPESYHRDCLPRSFDLMVMLPEKVPLLSASFYLWDLRTGFRN